MLKLLKAIFSGGDKTPARNLEDPRDLQRGDMLRLNDSYALPPELRGDTLQVTGVASYVYGEELYPEWTLKGSSGRAVYLTVEEGDGDPQALLCVKLKGKDVERLFGRDQIKAMRRNSGGFQLEAREQPEVFEGWLAPQYQMREGGNSGRWYNRDLRGQGVPAGGGEPLTYYELYSDDQLHGVEVEAWDEDEVDVMLTLCRPLSDIRELWPGGSAR